MMPENPIWLLALELSAKIRINGDCLHETGLRRDMER
jgi:hypothetical protein